MFVRKGRLILLAWTMNTQNNYNTQTHRVTYVRKHSDTVVPWCNCQDFGVCVCVCVHVCQQAG